MTIDQVEERLIEEIRKYEHFNSSVICTMTKHDVTERCRSMKDSPGGCGVCECTADDSTLKYKLGLTCTNCIDLINRI